MPTPEEEAAANTEAEAAKQAKPVESSATPPAEAKKTEHMIPKSRLDEEIAKREKAEQEAAALKAEDEKRKDAELTETQRLQKENEAKEKELATLRTEKMRGDAAKKVGLPAEFADRLKGSTPEEMEADAKAFLATLPKETKKTVIKAAAPEEAQPKEQTEAAFRKEVFGNGADIFNPNQARSAGGGLVMNNTTIVRKEDEPEK